MFPLRCPCSRKVRSTQFTACTYSCVCSFHPPDAIIHTRITNDEKALRRVTKKFHSYASVAYTPAVPLSPLTSSSVDDAREAFLLELASFQLSLKKSLMVCEAEARQVEEYQRERERIGTFPRPTYTLVLKRSCDQQTNTAGSRTKSRASK